MNEKISAFWEFVANIPPYIEGFLMAFVVSALRILYDDKQPHKARVALESLICGFLTLASSHIIAWLGWPEDMVIAVGGCIGFIGAYEIRKMALKYLNAFGNKKSKDKDK